jgi:hypothetical protein
VRQAIGKIEEITGRRLLDESKALMIPAQGVAGVDLFLATASAAPPLRVAVAGMMDDISLASARHAMRGTYARVVETLSLTDGRTEEERLSALVRVRPDVVLMVGGTDRGASAPVMNMLETLVLAASISPDSAKMR